MKEWNFARTTQGMTPAMNTTTLYLLTMQRFNHAHLQHIFRSSDIHESLCHSRMIRAIGIDTDNSYIYRWKWTYLSIQLSQSWTYVWQVFQHVPEADETGVNALWCLHILPLFVCSETCLPNPCLNGGTCYHQEGNSISCICHRGFVGEKCGTGRYRRCSFVYWLRYIDHCNLHIYICIISFSMFSLPERYRYKS